MNGDIINCPQRKIQDNVQLDRLRFLRVKTYHGINGCSQDGKTADHSSVICKKADCRHTDQENDADFICKTVMSDKKISEGTEGICSCSADREEKDVCYGK